MATGPTPRPPWLEHEEQAAGEGSGRCVSDFPTDFGFLNDTLALPVAQVSFQLFSGLPLELRRHIWELSLPQSRILKVTVTAAEVAFRSTDQSRGEESMSYQTQNDRGNTISGANYHLRLSSTNTKSPLLYVNREANAVFHSLYRVQVPIKRSSCNTPRLQFCPERDTILVTVKRDEDKAYFADFVHDALAYDPQGKGILHVAIIGTESIVLPIGLTNLHTRAQAALTSTLRSLESVSLVHIFHAKSRQMHSSLVSHIISNPSSQQDLVRFNRAYPLWSSIASYSILPVDPRHNVSRYLDLVDFKSDPRKLIRAWRTLEGAYNVVPTSPEKMRVLIATTDLDNTITTISQACMFRQQEEFFWSCDWGKSGIYSRLLPSERNPDNKEDLEFSKTQNAIGFWSVPVEAFGPVPEVPYDANHRWGMTRVCDLTNFESQIELGLFTFT